MIFIIHADMELWDFMLDGLKDREDIKNFPLNKYCNNFNRIVRKYFHNQKVPSRLVLGNDLRKELQTLVEGDRVIISAYTQLSLFNAVRQNISKGVKLCLWMWNPVSSNPIFKNNIEILRKEGVSLHTFDTKDSIDFGMNYHNTFYNMCANADSKTIKYDFYFLGAAKKRKDDLENLKKGLINYRCNFLIPSSSQDFISYKDNLKNIQESICIVEIVQNKQYDITLRPLEALAYKKKLLTNNHHIKRYPFYNPQNIFILGEDNFGTIDEFLNTPFIDVNEEIIKKFDINTWVDSF